MQPTISPAAALFRRRLRPLWSEWYVDEIWEMYASGKSSPSGKFIGKVAEGVPTVADEKTYVCSKKPSTQDILLGKGALSTNAPFCGAFNRHVAADPAD